MATIRKIRSQQIRACQDAHARRLAFNVRLIPSNEIVDDEKRLADGWNLFPPGFDLFQQFGDPTARELQSPNYAHLPSHVRYLTMATRRFDDGPLASYF